MDDWKASGQKKAKTLNKYMFPSLLKKLYVHLYPSNTETSSNLQAGFMKTGIFPLKPSQVWQSLPDTTNEQPENARDCVSGVVIDPGKSIGYEDLVQHHKELRWKQQQD